MPFCVGTGAVGVPMITAYRQNSDAANFDATSGYMAMHDCTIRARREIVRMSRVNKEN